MSGVSGSWRRSGWLGFSELEAVRDARSSLRSPRLGDSVREQGDPANEGADGRGDADDDDRLHHWSLFHAKRLNGHTPRPPNAR